MSEPINFHILLMQLHISLPESHSLKEKRKVVKSLKDRLKAKWNISIAEIGHHDKWQSALIGLTSIANDQKFLNSMADHIKHFVETSFPIAQIDWSVEYL